MTALALHGSFGRGSVFEQLARRLHGAARVIALDQRGHGHSPKRGPFDRTEFVADAAGAAAEVGGGEPVVVYSAVETDQGWELLFD